MTHLETSDPLSEALLEDDAAASLSSGLETAAMQHVQQLCVEGHLDAAIAHLDDRLREDGGGLALRALRAKLDYMAGHYASAAVRYATVAAEAEDIPSLRLNEALCLLRAARHDDAFAVLFRLLTRGVTGPRLWGYLGVALEHRDQYQDAAAAYHAGGYTLAARRMRRRKLDSTLVSAGAARLAQDELASTEESPAREDQLAQQTRGIEALRDPNRRTAPPTRFETDHGVTDMPRSFAGLLSEPEAADEQDGDTRPPRTLLDLTLAALLVVPTAAPWSRHRSGLICASAPLSVPIHYDPRAFVARASASGSRRADATIKGFATARDGRVVLAPRTAGETLHLLDLGGETLVVNDRYVVAFDASRGDGSLGPNRYEAPWPLEMLRFSGEGMLVLGLPEEFLTYDVRSGDDFELRAASLVGWAGELVVSLDGEGAPTSAPSHQRVRFAGNGTVLLLPMTSPMTSSQRMV